MNEFGFILGNMQLLHKLQIEQKRCCGRKGFSFYLGIYVKGSFLGPGFDWRFLEEATDLNSANLCWQWWHLTPKISHLRVSGVSTASELQGANISTEQQRKLPRKSST